VVAVLTLALARLWRGPTRWLLIVAGIAVATLLPMSAAATAAHTTTEALRHGVAALPPGAQSLIVSYPGLALDRAELAALDGKVRAELGRLTQHPVRSQMLFHQMSDSAGAGMFLGATDDLPGAVRLLSGRMPAGCTPTRCEMVLVGASPPRLPPELGIVIVGTAERTDPLLLSGTFEPAKGMPLLLADGVADAAAIDWLTAFQRHYGWVAALDEDRAAADLTGYLAASARAGDDLSRFRRGLFLTAPDDVLRAEFDRAQRSTRRFALLSGSATALLIGFAAIGAIGARRDHRAVAALLRRRGAPPRQLAAFTALTATVPVLAGTALGLLIGLAAAGSAALPGGALAQVAATSALAALVLALALSWSPEHPWRVLDTIVLAGATVAAVALARGAVTVGDLQGRTDPLLVALPVIALVCGGLLAGRLFPLLVPIGVRMAHRLPARASLPVRLGLAGTARRPLRAVATVAFLAAATGIVIFAGGYRSTLEQGAADQAAFAVPLDARVQAGTTLQRPLDVASMADYRDLGPETLAAPVLRATAGVRVNSFETRTSEIVGVPPEALTRVPAWDRVTGGAGAADSARLIARGTAAPGWPVPAVARRITFTVHGPLDNTTVVAWLRDTDGRDIGVTLQHSGDTLTATLPYPRSAARLFALAIAESPDYAARHLHHIGEGASSGGAGDVAILQGHLSFSGATLDGTALGAAFETDYQLTGARVVVPLGTPPGAAEAPLPVLADPVTAAAAAGGQLQLTVDGATPITARVVQVLPRFPAAGERFVVADAAALADILDARTPGTGSVSEIWLASADPHALGAKLRQAPFDRLNVTLRADLRNRLATDPLAVGAAGLLWSGALTALGVAVVALLLLVVAERRDDAAELYAWESDGLTPAALRGLLFARAAGVVAVAVPCVLLIGLALTRLTTALVLVTAVGSAPRPPLALATSSTQLAAVLGAGVGLGLLAAGLVAWRSFRAPLPARPEVL
jgi:hypothetical protein